ncbi:MAG: acyltransferase family protein [Acidimicrobiales bacterium]
MTRPGPLRRLLDGGAGRDNLPQLDGLRAAAVVAILVRHAWGVAGSPNWVVHLPFLAPISMTPFVLTLAAGVDLFFVLSGYLLARRFLQTDFEGRPRPSVRDYFRSRAYRILPLYWVTLVLVLALLTPRLIPTEEVLSVRGLFSFLAHAAVLQASFLVSYGSYSVASPFWTLTIEVVFYAVLPFLVVLFHRNRWMVTLPACIAVTLGWLWLARSSLGPVVDLLPGTAGRPGIPPEHARYFLSKQFPAHLADFAFGITVANLVCRARLATNPGRVARALASPAAGAVYLTAGVAATLVFLQVNGTISNRHHLSFFPLQVFQEGGWAFTWYYYLEELPFGASFALVLAGLLLCGPALRRPFEVGWVRLIGVLGYSIYLFHMPLIRWVNTHPALADDSPNARFLWLMAGAVATVIPLAVVAYLTIERPFMRRGRRRRSDRAARPAPIHLDDGASSREPAAPDGAVPALERT